MGLDVFCSCSPGFTQPPAVNGVPTPPPYFSPAGYQKPYSILVPPPPKPLPAPPPFPVPPPVPKVAPAGGPSQYPLHPGSAPVPALTVAPAPDALQQVGISFNYHMMGL